MRLFSSDPRDEWKGELADLVAEFEVFRSEDAARLDRAKQYREEIEATRDHQRQMRFSEPSDYGRKQRSSNQALQRHSFAFPLQQALTVKHSYRIAGRLPDCYVDKRDETALENWRSEVMEKIWWGVTAHSEGEAQFADAAWDASQVGSAAFEVYLDPKQNLQVPCYRAIDTGSLLVVPGLDDPHNFQRVYRWWTVPLRSFLLSYKGTMFRDVEVRVSDVQAPESNPVVTIVECCDKRRKIRFAVTNNSGNPGLGLEEWTHNYGFVPVAVCPNIGPYKRIWGWADYDFTREIIAYLGEFFGQRADVIRASSNGAYTLKGAKGTTPATIKKIIENGGVAPLNREGELEPVQVADQPAFVENHATMAMDLFERLGFAPPAAWGAIGAQSGSDRGLQLQPLTEYTSMKQKNWTAATSRLASFVFQIVEMVDGGKAAYSGVAKKGGKQSSFTILVGKDVPPVNGAELPNGEFEQLPRNPKEIFDGRYAARFEFADRVDYDDPAYVASQINLFVQGLISAQTCLERIGIRNPEDELKRLETEAEEMPWLRQGMLKLLEMQFAADQQGANDGSQNVDPAAMAQDGLDTMTQNDTAALDTDAGFGSMPGGVGVPYGGA